MCAILKPCPLCGSTPEMFPVRSGATSGDEVIACPRGCKPHWNSVVIHIRKSDIPQGGYEDLADAWNTVSVNVDPDGVKRVSFDLYPPHSHLRHEVGKHLPWSPEIAHERNLAAQEPTP